MKISFRGHKCSWFMVFCLTAILAIVSCNVWMLCDGYSVLNDYLKIPTIGWMLIVANLIAGLVFFTVKRSNNNNPGWGFCRGCQISLRDTWLYCPNCGGERSH